VTSDVLALLLRACVRIAAAGQQGSGYLVASDRIVTCGHVVAEVGVGGTVEVFFAGSPLEPAARAATVEVLVAAEDFALLRLAAPERDIAPLPLGGAVAPGAAWSAFGFPALAGTGLVIQGAVRNPGAYTRDGVPALQLYSPDVAAGHGALPQGFSGSPVMVEGRVVGHLRSILVAPSASEDRAEMGVLLACPIRCVQPHLASTESAGQGLAPRQPQPPGAAYHPAWYIARPAEERAACDYLDAPGAPAVLWGPELFGKTTLLRYLLTRLQQQDKQCRSVNLDLAMLDRVAKESLGSLLYELAVRMVEAVDGPPDWVQAAWERPGDPKRKLSLLLSRKILPAQPGRLVLALDRVDAVWGMSYQDDFFSLLRAWAEDACSEPWSQLRLLLSVSTTPTQLCASVSQSPFNLTPPIYLSDFSGEQAGELVRRYRLPWRDGELAALMTLVGGHPYLLRLAMYKSATGTAIHRILDEASRSGGLFEPQLNRYRSWLRQHPALLAAAQRLHKDPRCSLALDEEHRLHSVGLIRQDDTGAYRLRCRLYERLLS
jgi:hypothetical protein